MEAAEFRTIHLGSLTVNIETVIASWIVLFLLAIFFFLGTRKLSERPSTLQNILEVVYEYFQNLSRSMIGENGERYAPLALAIFFYLLFSNWLGLLPEVAIHHWTVFAPPTRDINTTLAMALITFLAFHYFGIASRIEQIAHREKEAGFLAVRVRGFLNYLAHYLHPLPDLYQSLSLPLFLFIVIGFGWLFLLLNVVEELARVLSLTLRLFSNMYGGHLILACLALLVVTMGSMSYLAGFASDFVLLFVLLLKVLVGLVQAFIFSILTLSYIGSAEGEEH
ncbi:MAG: FoF1 ATP synthase subunit a [bacterium]